MCVCVCVVGWGCCYVRVGTCLLGYVIKICVYKSISGYSRVYIRICLYVFKYYAHISKYLYE